MNPARDKRHSIHLSVNYMMMDYFLFISSDKFSRFDSSGSESDDESEDDSADEQPYRHQSLAGEEEEEEEVKVKDASDVDDNNSAEDQPSKDIPDTDISISAVNSSQIDSDKEHEEPGVDELDEPVIDNLGEAEEPGAVSEPEMDQEEENKLLAPSPSRDSEVRSEITDTPDLSVNSPEEVVTQKSAEGEESPTEDKSPAAQPCEQGEKSDESGLESESGSDGESGNESDASSSGSSSSSSTSSKDSASKSDSDDGGSGQNSARNSPERKECDSGAQGSNQASDSESDKEEPIRRLPVKRKVSTSQRGGSPSPKKQEIAQTPEERARLEARRRKFESSQEVQVTGNKRTISLKGIATKSRTGQRSVPVTNSATARSSLQTVTARAVGAPPDTQHKRLRRRVSLSQPADDSEEGGDKSESEEEEDETEEGGSRSWMREANKMAARQKTLKVDQSLPGSGSYHSNSFRGSSRNGGYHQRGYEPLRDNRPEIHYSSSEDDDSDQDSDRKMISVVVARSSAGTSSFSSQTRREWDSGRTAPPNRKRTANSTNVNQRGGRGAVSKSKRLAGLNSLAEDGPETGTISVVISGDPPSSNQLQSGGSRVSVHQRLGKGSSRKKEPSRTKSCPVAKKQPASDGKSSTQFMPSLDTHPLTQNRFSL